LNLDGHPELRASLDETRALYALYLAHAHAPEGLREQVRSARAKPTAPRVCAELAGREEAAISQYRLDKLKKLGALDPGYPLAYAVGIEQYRRGNHPAAAEAFRNWLEAHPSGPYALRARNYLKASIEAASF
jgi:hypothetical protein